MRRIVLRLAVVMAALMFTGCTGWNWSDPCHPCVVTPETHARYTR
jgi:hypothetical protein